MAYVQSAERLLWAEGKIFQSALYDDTIVKRRCCAIYCTLLHVIQTEAAISTYNCWTIPINEAISVVLVRARVIRVHIKDDVADRYR